MSGSLQFGRKREATLVSVFVTMLLVLGLGWVATASPANAAVADKLPAARNKMVGKSALNLKTDMQTVITGTYKYYRKVKIKGKWKKKAFFGIKIMACKVNKKDQCKSDVLTGKLRSPYQPGKAVGTKTSARETAPRAKSDFCLSGTSHCAAPWNWINKGVSDTVGKGILVVNKHVIKPCLRGGLAGFGGVASVNITTRVFFLGGLITAAQVGGTFTGPAGKAIVTVSGCGVGVAHDGIKRVRKPLVKGRRVMRTSNQKMSDRTLKVVVFGIAVVVAAVVYVLLGKIF